MGHVLVLPRSLGSPRRLISAYYTRSARMQGLSPRVRSLRLAEQLKFSRPVVYLETTSLVYGSAVRFCATAPQHFRV